MTNKLRVPLVLMTMAILVIIAFQGYWLRKNYHEEKHLFTVKTNVLFRETLMRLQAAKLHLDSNISIRISDKEGIVNMGNIMGETIRDSTQHVKRAQAAVMVTMRRTDSLAPGYDTSMHYQLQKDPGGQVFNFLLGADSLRDTISVQEITDKYKTALAKQKIHLAFAIQVEDAGKQEALQLPDLEDNRVLVGFVKPKAYQAMFVNSNWYVIKQMSSSIWISLLVIGITCASFLLLYRNLLRQQKLTQFKNDFISNMTHELKTPIATVSVAVEALKNFNALQDPQRTQEYLDISANEIHRLGLLVDKVLKLSMYEKKEITLNKEPFNLADLAGEVIASMRLQFEKLQADVQVKTTGNNFIIEADRLHLCSVLYNLLDNALKYSTDKPVIAVHIIDHANCLELSVTDNGIGIAPEYRYKVFEQFFRVPGGNRHNIKGYGLGLSYVNHIVQRHQGFIEVKSKLGEGSRFGVLLPFKEAAVIDYGNGRKVIKKEFKLGKA